MDSEPSNGRPGPRRAAVAVICRSEKYLVIKRSENVRAPGEYCFPGGGIEPDESPESALIRELKEELNVTVTPLEEIWESLSPWGVRISWWHADLCETQEIEANPDEVETHGWMTLDEILSLPNLLASNAGFFEAHARGEFDLPE